MIVTSAINSALSGMAAASAMFGDAAANIANLNSSGYRPQQPDLASLPDFGGAAMVSFGAYPSPYSNDSGGSDDGDQDSNGDLTDQVVQMCKASMLYDANAAVVRMSNQMTGTLLDITADDNDDNGDNS
jgi:flagellar basal body rod protein FlgG